MSAQTRVALATRAQQTAWLAFAVMVVLSPFRARFDLLARPVGTVYGDYTDVLLFWSDIPALLVLSLWLASRVLRPRSLWLGPRFLAWPVAALLILSFLGAPFAADPGLAVLTSARLVGLAALALFVANELDEPARLLVPVAVMVVLQSVIGIAQVAAQHSLGLSSLGEHVLSPSLGVSVITESDGARIVRAYGLTDHPNILGGVLVVGLLLVGGLASIRRRPRATVPLAILSLGAAALVVTFSRGAWLSLVAGLAVLAVMLIAMRHAAGVRRLAVVCAAGLVVATPLVLPYRAALAARTDPVGASATEVRSVDERTALSEATAALIASHPVLGVGAGGVPEAMRAANPSFRYAYQPASVVALDVTAETGLAGGAAYLVLLLAPWVVLLLRRVAWTPELAVASAALAAITVVGLFDYYTWTYQAGRIWSWLILGLWAVTYRNAQERAPRVA